MFFKRLSRSRTNSYVDDYDSAKENNTRPSSSRQSTSVGPQYQSDHKVDMYPRTMQTQEVYNPSQHRGMNGGGMDGLAGAAHHIESPVKIQSAPDLLTQAFNAAVRPYTEKIEQLEYQLADLQSLVEQLEAQRVEVHSWIDKRGLRPDVPPSIAKVMDGLPSSADSLNAQLDRKITIVNFDLHRLQDDLNDSISSAHFAASMSKFLPDINRLSNLPTGPRYAFDLILKLGGNLNSHGGLDAGDPEDLEARRRFYERLDEAMVEVIRRRFAEAEEWQVQREIKRIEKTGAYLRNFGVEGYFVRSLDLMRREGGMGQGGGNSPPRY